jgi:hypothetical protein
LLNLWSTVGEGRRKKKIAEMETAIVHITMTRELSQIDGIADA